MSSPSASTRWARATGRRHDERLLVIAVQFMILQTVGGRKNEIPLELGQLHRIGIAFVGIQIADPLSAGLTL